MLRNAELIGREHRDQLWEYRVLVIPEITDREVPALCDFIASIDRSLPVCFLAFRPNYVLEEHPGAEAALMEYCLDTARKTGLVNAHWSGHTGLHGTVSPSSDPALRDAYTNPAALLAAAYAARAGVRNAPSGLPGVSGVLRHEVLRAVPGDLISVPGETSLTFFARGIPHPHGLPHCRSRDAKKVKIISPGSVSAAQATLE